MGLGPRQRWNVRQRGGEGERLSWRCVACSGATTNSDSGVTDVLAARLKPTLQAMAELGVLLLVHGEVRLCLGA